MANLFIGFPVSKAKIADMITGSAPPTVHHTWHETGGTDVLDGTKIPGAGGITLPWDDLYYHTFFDSIGRFTQSNAGSGAVTLSNQRLSLTTGATINSRAYIYDYPQYLIKRINFGKESQLITRVKFNSLTSKIGLFLIYAGDTDATPHIGFKVVNGVLYGSIGDYNQESTVALQTLGTGQFLLERLLKAHLIPDVGIKFYVDGTELGEITTDLPPEGDDTLPLCTLWTSNPGVAESKELYLSQYTFWQAA